MLASRVAAQPVTSITGWPERRLLTAISRHEIPMRNPVPSAFEHASFCGPAFGIGTGDVSTAFRFLLFDVGKDPIAKAVTETIKRARDAFDIRKISTDA